MRGKVAYCVLRVGNGRVEVGVVRILRGGLLKNLGDLRIGGRCA